MAKKNNLYVDQGSTYSTTIVVNDSNEDPFDLTGYTASSQIRKHPTSCKYFAFTANTNGATGEVNLSLSANTTANLQAGRYLYDVEIKNTSNGAITRVAEGIVTVSPNITR